MKRLLQYIGYIYKIVNNLNNNIYIGQTTSSLNRRFKQHINDSRRKKTHLYNAMNKYGVENFYIQKICKIKSPSQEELKLKLNSYECWLISYFDTFNNGYNSTLGGEGTLGTVPSQETREKLKIANSGKSNGFYGKQHSKQTKDIIGAQSKGRKSVLKGTKLPEAQKQKMILTKMAKSKFVAQYSMGGILIKVFDNIKQAHEETGIPYNNIAKSAELMEKGCSAGGYLWVYLSNKHDVASTIKVYNRVYGEHCKKRVIQFDKNNDYIQIYDCVKGASINTYIGSSNISACCRGKQSTAGGYKWMYYEDYIKQQNQETA